MVMKIVLKTQPPKIVVKLVEQLRISSELAQWRLVMLLWPLHFCLTFSLLTVYYVCMNFYCLYSYLKGQRFLAMVGKQFWLR